MGCSINGSEGSSFRPCRQRDVHPVVDQYRDPERSDEPLRYLVVDCFPGGRPSHEPTWESHVRVVCEENGWDFDQVRR